MTTIGHDTTARLRIEKYKLEADIADLKVKLAGCEDRLADALETSQHWRMLYHDLLELDDTEVTDG